jgi:DNA-directed RNA polymerase subunit RPC12/RpoP
LDFLGTEIRCKKCDHVLFEFDAVPNDLLWYSELRYKLDGECPNCGHKLPNISRYAKKMQFKVKSTIPVIAE